jgi:hypothetical protein
MHLLLTLTLRQAGVVLYSLQIPQHYQAGVVLDSL